MIDDDAHFELWSFGEAAGRPVPHALLRSSRAVVLMSGDGGSVADTVDDLQFPFAPSEALLEILGTRRRVVAHLRVGDEHEDERRGLFRSPNATEALRAALPIDTYVLSDSSKVLSSM